MNSRKKKVRQNIKRNAPEKAAVRRKNTRLMRRTSGGQQSIAEARLDKKADTILAKAKIIKIDEQPKIEYRNVQIDDLQIDNSYQRPLKEGHIADIMLYFNWEGFGTPVIGHRGNRGLWLIDGQQRITAAQRLGATTVGVEVRESTGPKYEASLFHLLNSTSVVPSKMQIFRAALRAGNKNAVAINKAVKEAGFKIHLGIVNYSGNEWPHIRALSRLENMFKYGGVRFLKEVLSLIGETWPEEDDSIREDVIGGMHRFIRFTRYSDPRPRGWLNEYMPSRGMTRRARIIEAITQKGLTSAGLHNKAANSKESASGYSRAEAVQRILDETCRFNSRRRAPKATATDEEV